MDKVTKDTYYVLEAIKGWNLIANVVGSADEADLDRFIEDNPGWDYYSLVEVNTVTEREVKIVKFDPKRDN